MANINQISPDGGTTVYDIEDPTARSGVNSLTPRVGIAEGKITTLQEQMLSVEDDLDALGTASTKNSTSVVTESSDLVESGAVYDALGFGNKNIVDPSAFIQGLLNNSGAVNSSTQWITSDYMKCKGTVTVSGYKDGAEVNFCVRFAEYDSNKTFIKLTNDINVEDVAFWSDTITLDENTEYVRISAGFNNKACTPSDYFSVNRLQLEKGSTATAYEPYHASVEESLDDKADNSVIGTVEDGTTASQAYAVGSHAIRNGAFITWKNAKAQGETINDASDYTSGDVADVITDLEDGLISSTRPWSGNTLTFNIPQNNGIMYRLTAIESNSMHYVDTILVNRADGIAKHDFGEAITCSYTSGNLVITLPSTDYYMYKMEQIKNGIN